jgi:hypothetical protein
VRVTTGALTRSNNRQLADDVALVVAACQDRIASLGKDKAVINCQWVLDQLAGKPNEA